MQENGTQNSENRSKTIEISQCEGFERKIRPSKQDATCSRGVFQQPAKVLFIIWQIITNLIITT